MLRCREKNSSASVSSCGRCNRTQNSTSRRPSCCPRTSATLSKAREMAIVSALAVSRGGYVNLGVVREEAARVAGVLAPDFDEALVRTMALLRAPHRLTVESTTCRSYFAHDPVELMYEHPAVVALARTPSRVEDADDNPTIRAQLRDDYRAIAARHDREVLRPGGIKRAREREAVERAAVRE